MIGLLVVEMIIGYEWFISGLVKFMRGDFPSGLAAELLEKSKGVAAWYGSFLQTAVIPNAVLFGYVIEISELLAGIALIAGPLIWLFAWERVHTGKSPPPKVLRGHDGDASIKNSSPWSQRNDILTSRSRTLCARRRISGVHVKGRVIDSRFGLSRQRRLARGSAQSGQ